MSQENVETIRRGFELWQLALAGTLDEAEAISQMASAYHPDAEIDFSRTMPDLAPTNGTGRMVAWMRASGGLFKDVRLRPIAVVDAGDAVVAEVQIAGTGATSGVSMEMVYAYVFHFRDGQVVSATSYLAMQEALKALGLEP
jgi:ketosteroid isomerase-like protein